MLQSDIDIFKEAALELRKAESHKEISLISGSKYMIAAISQLEDEGKVKASFWGDTVGWSLVDE